MVAYIAKSESEIGQMMKEVAEAMAADATLRKKMHYMANQFFRARKLSQPEVIHLSLGLPLVMNSRTVVVMPAGFPHERTRMKKNLAQLQRLEEEEGPDSEEVTLLQIQLF